MRETFQHHQKLVSDLDGSGNILSVFAQFLNIKGLVDLDFTLLFDDETYSMLLEKWGTFFRPNKWPLLLLIHLLLPPQGQPSCQASQFLGALDELFKAHFVFNLSYTRALVTFHTLLQTTLYNTDVWKMKESPE
ncbi:hypothetical protein Q5P01_024524 [Channa striata]|uniref:Uncharacterized protein n=1 Tax=Channa striata TaxID=64152 RepID=A0AA88ILI7_CHASR|nr:hypothetical protein Q5P01_024524 [Channa striata]